MSLQRKIFCGLLLFSVLAFDSSTALSQGGRPPQGGGGKPQGGGGRPGGGGQPGNGGSRPPSGGGNNGGNRPPSGGGNPGNRPPSGGNNGGNRPPNNGGNRPPNNGGNRPPNNGGNRPPNNGGGRPPNQGGGRPPQGRPPQWGQRPPNRPNYAFRPNDRSYLRRYYSRNLGYVNMGMRPRFVVGGFFPWSYVSYITPVPPQVYGYLPPPPPGYQMGYYQGYVVVYDPLTYFIANVIDLMQ
ncbi:MAG: hypothetical protein PW789_09625 [Edaphobacter sp.]|uniref:hypothetical protein n=1 Tax=Edaphobacter sp. TaxID=1934404 RepID=UPI00238C62B8|nr:hypothetical protein [Edaphobacter sp.]MDE1176853.1 hypothetical protein [Edaphobacter sp.]